MPDYGEPDLYRSPKYSDLIADAVKEFTTSPRWDDWDLDGLLVDIPMSYANKLGVKYGIFCCTGTAGLHASLMALPLRPGDEIILPCMTFIRCATPLVHLGLIPVLADIDPSTGNLDPNSLASVISARTKAVLVVHMWGIPADMRGLASFCKDHGLYLIEDFSHAHFSRHSDGFVGSFGHVAYASMQRKKTLSVGEGGLIVTKDEEIYVRLRQITSPGSFKGTPNYNEFSGFGLNLRMSPFSALIAEQLFSYVDKVVEDRAAQAQAFSEMLARFPDYIVPPNLPAYAELVSAYGYKPQLGPRGTIEMLRKANQLQLWRFAEFSYGHIKDDVFWTKSSDFYPFCQRIKPKVSGEYPGYDKYMKGRVGLSVPTVGSEYWTDAKKSQWMDALRNAFS
ncbi:MULTISPECIES: DegT/DnrJ/EryC1/StrS family aminotransferase [unclassified Caballeronia]|uniref:DegT/DnrJ/EryC1/StrS family aminotransferase n=1 Tax=unclassified Caballeronia TaxID=2646786 RepID=UPI002028AF37|nr:MULTISPECIES: DegT/DnrJ/EryC1/StrS family aminotransferase [unclassified Caballeronia]